MVQGLVEESGKKVQTSIFETILREPWGSDSSRSERRLENQEITEHRKKLTSSEPVALLNHRRAGGDAGGS
jgi:hypothetical protein